MSLTPRKTPRAQWYDYSSPGMYFVTVCTKERVHYFGEIQSNVMTLSNIGNICNEQLHVMLEKRPRIDMHEHIIMPNHVYLLFYMNEPPNDCRDTGLPCPNDIRTPQADVPTPTNEKRNQILGSVIGGRKSAVSRHSHKQGYSFERQKRFHDRIVRNEKEYITIKHYIQTNPQQRKEDTFYS